MSGENLKNVIEALLFSSSKPLGIPEIVKVLSVDKNGSRSEIKKAIEDLNSEYNESGKSFFIENIAGGYRMITKPEYAEYIKILYQVQPSRLSKPSLETLAIVAYRQPIIKADIEAIRGVNVDGIVKTLLEKDFIKISGRKDVPGRPFLLTTTNKFLEYFGLKDLNELPKISELRQFSIAK